MLILILYSDVTQNKSKHIISSVISQQSIKSKGGTMVNDATKLQK